VQAHETALQFGGVPGIHDLNLVHSAIGRPYSGYHPRIYRKAATITQSLACNHGFVDGNKRTAFLVVNLLLANSGYKLAGPESDPDVALEDFIVHVVKDHLSLETITEWFRFRIVKA